ncbi:MAG: hemolysin III family protein [Acidobacteriota bacterium]
MTENNICLNSEHDYTLGEEIFNSISHGLGFLASVVGLVFLTLFAVSYGDVWHIVSFSIFGVTLILLYLASTLYHSLTRTKAVRIMQAIDHSAIFLLIAGTYTPFMLTVMRSALGWTILSIVWGIAIIGILLKVFHFEKTHRIGLVLYLLMGWIIVLVFFQVVKLLPLFSLIMLFAGGFFYTAGTVFYKWNKLKYNHAIWHLFVLGGSICHYFSVISTV